MSKKLDNQFVPRFFSNNLPWYEREVKCQEFLEDTEKHFQNLKIINFDIINSKGTLSEDKIKQYQTINHCEILSYPPDLQDEILSSIFRTMRDDMFVKKETVMEHFKKPVKSVGRGGIIKKKGFML